jgi:peptidoglycan/xylan/chitin deacetylase (PgdA/CDA1 family)
VWDGELARPLATPDDLVALSREGFEVGNHTFSHPRLGILSWVEVVRQLAEADRHLRELGLAPATLCLPYGSESAVATEWAMATGYRAVLTLRKGVLTRNDQAMAVPRVLISYGDSLPMFFYKVFIRAPRRRLVYSGVPGL